MTTDTQWLLHTVFYFLFFFLQWREDLLEEARREIEKKWFLRKFSAKVKEEQKPVRTVALDRVCVRDICVIL